MLEITHNDDKKEKHQSHTVSMADREGANLYPFDFSSIYGFGSSYEEALEDFKQNFDKEITRLRSFEKMLFETDALVPIEVDCRGKIIKEKP